jgi:hypothetical protein
VKESASEFRDSILWTAVGGILTELNSTGEIVINTSPNYVIAYVCQELAAKKLVTVEALRPRRGSEGPRSDSDSLSDS